MNAKITVAAVAIALSNVVSASAASHAGTSSLSFLNFPVGSRALAMGEAASATTQGAEALFWNPAGLGLSHSRSFDIILNHQPMLEFMNYDVGAFAWSNGFFSTGVGFARLSQKDLDVLDLSGTKVRSAQAYDQQAVLGAALGNKRWGAGLSVKVIQSKLDDVTATAVAGDAGVRFPGFFKNLSHAIVVQNVGSSIAYDSESYALPLTVRGGSALKIGKAVVAVDAVKPKDTGVYVAAGGEMPLLSGRGLGFKLRGGYRTNQSDLGGMAGFSLGTGLELGGFRLDYAWLPTGDFGDSHNISVGFRHALSLPNASKVRYEKNESGRYSLPKLRK